MARRPKKVSEGFKNTFSIEAVSVGYDRFFDTIGKLAEDQLSTMWYPPYNIRKTSPNDYVIDVEVTGYDKKEISARLEDGALVITAPGKANDDPEGDDVYYHQGIFPGGELNIKFFVAENLSLDSAEYDDGIISFKFKYIPADNPSLTVPIGPFATETLTKPYTPVYDSSGRPVGGKSEESSEVQIFVPEKREEVATIVNDDTSKKPTVEVIALDPMPQIVEVALENVADKIDKKSDEPQASIVLSDATYEVVSDNAVTDVLKTDEGKSDIVVAIPQEVADAAKDAGINIMDSVEKAINKTEVDVPALPDVAKVEEAPVVPVEVTPENAEPVTVNVPEVVSSVMEAKVVDGEVHLSDASENIHSSAELVPVITKDDQPDIMVAVTPSTQEHLDELGVDVAKDIGTAVIEAEAEVAPAVVEPGPVFETVDTPVVVNGESDEKPTVEVVLPSPLPQIVEVSADNVADSVDVTSETPQATLNVTEAVHEVSDNVVTEVIKTEEGKSDIVVAVPEELHAELADKGIDVVDAVKTAIAESELPAPELPEVQPTPDVTTPIVTEAGTQVEVVAPESIPQVVEATLEQKPVEFNSAGAPIESVPQVVISDVSGDVPADAELIPVVTAKDEHDVMVAVTPETKAALDEAGVDVMKDVGAALVEAETTVVTAEPVAAEVTEPEPTVTTTVLNADNPEVPTVAVTVPDPLPQIVEVSATKVDNVDPASTEPQVELTVTDATHEVSDNVLTDVIKTEEGKSDVVVAVPEELHAELSTAGVDPIESVKAAVEEAAPAAPELPAAEPQVTAEPVTVTVPDEATSEPKVEVTTPEVIPQVVEAVVTPPAEEGGVPAVELVPASEDIPADSTVVPVVTMEGQPDVMVAVTPDAQATLDAAGVDVAKDVGAALVEGEVEVAKSEETPPQ